MPHNRYTPTEDMLAKRIMKQYIAGGVDKKLAKSIGYATVNKMNTNPRFRSNVNKRMNMNKIHTIHVGHKKFRV